MGLCISIQSINRSGFRLLGRILFTNYLHFVCVLRVSMLTFYGILKYSLIMFELTFQIMNLFPVFSFISVIISPLTISSLTISQLENILLEHVKKTIKDEHSFINNIYGCNNARCLSNNETSSQ